jgi:hypothetical protein
MCLLLALSLYPLTLALSREKRFKLDVDAAEEDTGEKFQLHSQGTVARIIDLDILPEVKVVAGLSPFLSSLSSERACLFFA